MKNYWIIGILGLVVVFLNFLGLPSLAKAGIFIVCGLLASFISFREIIRKKLEEKFNSNDAGPDEAAVPGQTEGGSPANFN